METPKPAGPLHGIRVLEMAAIGPAPSCAMLLAELGADVLRIERPQPGGAKDRRFDITSRSRDSIVVDLKQPEGIAQVMALVPRADILLEGSRPGVTERLVLGTAELLRVNPRLVLPADDRLGPDRPVVADCRTRHQLHRPHRGAACHRAGG